MSEHPGKLRDIAAGMRRVQSVVSVLEVSELEAAASYLEELEAKLEAVHQFIAGNTEEEGEKCCEGCGFHRFEVDESGRLYCGHCGRYE